MTARRHVLDVTVRRSADGLLLAGGVPARIVRLTRAGADALDRALAGEQPSPAEEALLERLRAAALLHPAGARPFAAELTIIVPVRNGAAWLETLVRALLPGGRVLVVDDGSTDDSAAIAAAAGAHVVENDSLPGPAGARNTGLSAAATELVAFVDDDCVVAPGWLDPLASRFDDPRLALAAPRVRSVPGPSRLERYERSCSPLDLGPHPGLVAPRHRVTFVPAAALVARRAALLEVGGFDPRLKVGEDVDLVWRLAAAGWSVRYAPESEVLHRPRPTLRALLRQRFDYGTSAAPLEHRHPGAAAPLHVAPHTAAIWIASAAAGPAAGVAAFTASALAAAASRCVAPSARAEVVRLVVHGHLQATRRLARVGVREWLPLTVVAAALSPRVRRWALAAFALDALAAGGDPLLRLADNAAYAAGLWRGALAVRSPAALLVRRAPSRANRTRSGALRSGAAANASRLD